MKIINLLPSHFIEHEYFNKMFEWFDNEVFAGYTIYVTENYDSLPSYGNNVIVIATAGNERGIPPKYSEFVKFVFKHHLDQDKIGKNVYHIPLTYVNGFNGNSDIPILDRQYDVFFVGQANRREDMISAVNSFIKRNPHLRYCFYVTGKKFMGGWPVASYAKAMEDSKIVLSPRGGVRPECLRFTEAVKCGCAIIACKHPKVTLFKECPAIYTNNWDNLESTVLELLKNKERLYSIGERMKESWKTGFSPKAVGEYITKIVKNNNANN
jgi:hypothetical protein